LRPVPTAYRGYQSTNRAAGLRVSREQEELNISSVHFYWCNKSVYHCYFSVYPVSRICWHLTCLYRCVAGLCDILACLWNDYCILCAWTARSNNDARRSCSSCNLWAPSTRGSYPIPLSSTLLWPTRSRRSSPRTTWFEWIPTFTDDQKSAIPNSATRGESGQETIQMDSRRRQHDYRAARPRDEMG
jgi:hypothetical protein